MTGEGKTSLLMLGRNSCVLPVLTAGFGLESRFVYVVGNQQNTHIYF